LQDVIKQINEYYQLQQKNTLQDALSDLNKPLKCPETKKKSIELKISVLVLLNEFKWGSSFIDSLNDDDFTFPYKKQMNYDYLIALDYDANGDTIARNKLIYKIVENITGYIKQSGFSEENFSEDVFYDLLFMKNKIIKGEAFKKEIDSLENKYPYKTSFFEIFREGFDDTSKSSAPVKNEA
jgi:hypothetical protein